MVTAVSGRQLQWSGERGALRDALRELLFEIPGFRALAERGISAELISGGGGRGGLTLNALRAT